MSANDAVPQKVQFIENHRPSLRSGTYTIAIAQTLQDRQGEIPSETTFKAARTFYVEGDQFALNPQTVYGVYPGASSQSNYQRVLPSILLKRSTLPWERTAQHPPWHQGERSTDAPWLALLLFHPEEIGKVDLTTVNTLKTVYGIESSAISASQKDDDSVALIHIPRSLAEVLIPPVADLPLLSHVRQGIHEDGSTIELAAIIGNRLPTAGVNRVHLVALENYFEVAANHNAPNPDNSDADNSQATVALVSLYSWEFECSPSTYTEDHFEALLKNLDVGTLRLPDKPQSSPLIVTYRKQGYIPLKQHLRNFETTVSWYRSPLLPGRETPHDFPFPVRAADTLLIYDPAIALFDTTYAAAWQLGRLLALQDKSFAISLFNWKRQYRQQKQLQADWAAAATATKTLPNPDSIAPLFSTQQLAADSEQVPPNVTQWLRQLTLLDSIPFNYLVPDPNLLPPESLRFFVISSNWLACAIDGAFGIGDVLTQSEDYQACKNLAFSNLQPSTIVTGFLMRSQVIKHYPSLEIKALEVDKDLEMIRLERLADDVMIGLFAGTIDQLTINQKPEALHFGLESDAKLAHQGEGFYLQLRNLEGTVLNNSMYNLQATDWRDHDRHILNIQALASHLEELLHHAIAPASPLTSLHLAMQLIEGSAIVQFMVTAPSESH